LIDPETGGKGGGINPIEMSVRDTMRTGLHDLGGVKVTKKKLGKCQIIFIKLLYPIRDRKR